ncbi:MAG: YCF48-related protein [Bacteroidales bacterium]|nr:YCF48-related protein [Bacteroidales bacterium]
MKIKLFISVLLTLIYMKVNAQAVAFSSVKFLNSANTAIVAGYPYSTGEGVIIKTTDNDWNNWLKQNIGTTNGLYSVFFVNSNIGYASGVGETILKTTDAGANWVCQHSVQYLSHNLTSIFFTDSSTGYAVGSYKGMILKTTNGGTNWVLQVSGTIKNLKSVYFTDVNTGFVVGLGDTLLTTTNGGGNWIKQSTGTGRNLVFICFIDSNTGFAAGTTGSIIKTTDGGNTWVIENTGTTNNLSVVKFIDSNTGFAVGSNGTIIKTTNGGNDWFPQNSGTKDILNSVDFFDMNTGYAVGVGNIILKTTDGGNHWFFKNKSFEFLDINNIYARINPGNELFSDGVSRSVFEVPKGSGRNTIWNSIIWVAGKDSKDSLHIAAQRYDITGQDFICGPISDVADSIWYGYDTTWYGQVNKIWKLNKSDIDYHKQHWSDAGYVPVDGIATWPGNGDTSIWQAAQLAPYYDNNIDGIYDPLDGDYPLIRGDQAIYFILNDAKKYHVGTRGYKLGVELHCMAYAFNCPDSAFWNTIFLNYKIINRSKNTYTNAYISNFTDLDIGGNRDDFVGCDVQRGTFYGYNATNTDVPYGNVLAYGKNPPVQGVTILGGPFMDADGTDNPKDIDNGINGLNFGDGVTDNERLGLNLFINSFNDNTVKGDPFIANQYYNFMRGYWKDGLRMQYGGDGYDSTCGPAANFMYPRNTDPLHWGTNYTTPNCNVNDWDEITVGNIPYDIRGIGSMGPFTFYPDSIQEIDIALPFARNYNDTDKLAALPILQQRVDSIRKHFINNTTPCGGVIINNNVKEKQIKNRNITEIRIYPIPANNQITIELGDVTREIEVRIYNVSGQEIFKSQILNPKSQIDISGFSSGVYFVKFISPDKVEVRKIIKE